MSAVSYTHLAAHPHGKAALFESVFSAELIAQGFEEALALFVVFLFQACLLYTSPSPHACRRCLWSICF